MLIVPNAMVRNTEAVCLMDPIFFFFFFGVVLGVICIFPRLISG